MAVGSIVSRSKKTNQKIVFYEHSRKETEGWNNVRELKDLQNKEDKSKASETVCDEQKVD